MCRIHVTLPCVLSDALSVELQVAYKSTLFLIIFPERHVDVLEDGRNGVYLQNATYKRTADAAECTSLFRQGWANRTKGPIDYETRAAVFFSLDLSMVRIAAKLQGNFGIARSV